ncbi:hypothetical protein ACQPYA_20985 [Micromonospora sp. CA-263727]|uniref:hypothetical protein n=1 Tax=Micromonospora sp. CA-263727 TaxID=3239967 RepID=UPI003D92DFC6
MGRAGIHRVFGLGFPVVDRSGPRSVVLGGRGGAGRRRVAGQVAQQAGSVRRDHPQPVLGRLARSPVRPGVARGRATTRPAARATVRPATHATVRPADCAAG